MYFAGTVCDPDEDALNVLSSTTVIPTNAGIQRGRAAEYKANHQV